MLQVSFLGDISLNNQYNTFHKAGVNPFSDVQTILDKSDFVTGNLECMSEGNKGENKLKFIRLKTAQKTLDLLKYLNLKCVTLAHNHVYDNLKDGYEKTVEALKAQEIQYLGAGLSTADAQAPLIIEENGITLGLLNYMNKNTNPKMPDDADVYVNYQDINLIQDQIAQIRNQVDHVIVLLHWGGRVEEGFYPDRPQPTVAKQIIEAGADLIVGGHSHTVQPYEIYKGKYIFYSLGNFCFDDIVQGDEIHEIGRYRKRKTIIPTVTFQEDQYSVKIDHAKNKAGFIRMNNSAFRKLKWKWRNTLFYFVKNSVLLWKIYFWHLKKVVPIKMYFLEANKGPFKTLLALDFKRMINYIKK